MIVCICRNISDKDYATKEELLERLKQDDFQCATCIKHIEEMQNEREVC